VNALSLELSFLAMGGYNICMCDGLVMLYEPNLRSPALVAGFGGWPNAGEVSSWVITFLIQNLGGARFAEIRPESFFDLIQQRPMVSIEGGRVRSVQFPCGAFYAAGPVPGSSRDLVLFLGQEPHLLWPRFSELFLKVVQRLGITEVLTVGGLYDNIPHTVEPRVSGITNDDQRLERFSELRIRPAQYEGPMSIHTHLLVEAESIGLPATSIWGHVPYYIQSNNAKTSLAILERLQSLLGVRLDLREVRRASEILDEEVERIVQDKPELRQYIQNLEKEYFADENLPFSAQRPIRRVPTPGEKVIHIDPFLRKG